MLVNRNNLTFRVFAAVALLCAPALAEQPVDQAKATKVKAAYLYNFTKFVEWPETSFKDKDDPIVIGVLGTDPFGATLDKTVRGKKVKDRGIVVQRFTYQEGKGVDALKSCHVLYVSSSLRTRLKSVLTKLRDSSMLVVGEGADFAPAGGMIGLVFEKGRIAFQVNVEAVEHAGLKVSAKFLSLAKIVRNKDQGG